MSATVRKSSSRGHADHGWLDSRHTFSFADYHDPEHMGFGPLRVINEDRVQPGAGFAEHGHRDMEILSYVMDGALEHKDSIGTGSVIRPGDVQIMSAGTGIRHSEFNHSKIDPVHFLQIWVTPDQRDLKPRYEQKTIPESEKKGRLRLIASREGREGSIVIHRDADVFATILDANDAVRRDVKPDRRVWIQIVRGAGEINGTAARAGDGVALVDESRLSILSHENGSEFLVFDLP